MVSPAGFVPAAPGLEGPHFGVSGVFQMRCNPYISAIPGFRSIYAVAHATKQYPEVVGNDAPSLFGRFVAAAQISPFIS